MKKILWTALVLAIFLTALWQFYPLPDATKRFETLPLMGIGYAGRDVPLSDFERTFFQGVNVIKRLYQVDNQLYFVTVLDGTHNRHVVHDPYYCFRGSGWQILSEREIQLRNGQAREVEISKDDQHKSALFWFSDTRQQYDSPLKFWWEATKRRLTLGNSGKEPVLIMIQPLDNQIKIDWPKVLKTLNPLIDL